MERFTDIGSSVIGDDLKEQHLALLRKIKDGLVAVAPEGWEGTTDVHVMVQSIMSSLIANSMMMIDEIVDEEFDGTMMDVYEFLDLALNASVQHRVIGLITQCPQGHTHVYGEAFNKYNEDREEEDEQIPGGIDKGSLN